MKTTKKQDSHNPRKAGRPSLPAAERWKRIAISITLEAYEIYSQASRGRRSAFVSDCIESASDKIFVKYVKPIRKERGGWKIISATVSPEAFQRFNKIYPSNKGRFVSEAIVKASPSLMTRYI